MKVKSIAECSPWGILQYFWPALSDNWSSFLSGRLRQVLLYNQKSIYIYAYKCLCQCVGKVYNPNINCGEFDMLGPIVSENDPPFFAPWVTSAHQSWKKSEALHWKDLCFYGLWSGPTSNLNQKSVYQPASSSRESNCELVGSVWPAQA